MPDDKILDFPNHPIPSQERTARSEQPLTIHASSIEVARDGNQVFLLLGRNLQFGCAGFGSTLPEALRELAADIEDRRLSIFIAGKPAT